MNKQNKLNSYFNAAKNNGTEFTQSELQRIVESVTNDNKSSTNITSTNKSERTILMITLGLTLVSGITGSLLWLGLPASTPPSRTVLSTNVSETKNNKQKVQYNQPHKESRIISKTKAVKEVAPTDKTVGSENAKHFNIDGITTIHLTKDELTKLEIIVGNDCGITAYNGFLTGTYYNVNNLSLDDDSKPNQSDASQNANRYKSVWQMPSSNEAKKPIIYPILSTSINGRILSDALGQKVETEASTKNDSNSDLSNQNSSKKPRITLYIYPDDTTTTEKEIQDVTADTSKYITEYKRLTPEDVIQMKRKKEERQNKIYEYLKLNKLIAIKANAVGCPDNSVIFWFEPTEDFIKSLPLRFHADLTNQFIKQRVLQTEIRDTYRENPKTGCEYTDICRTTSGAVIESSVFPNPANESASLRFELTEQRKCTFSLHDLNGVYIKELTKESTLTKGEHTIAMDIHDVKAGVYLLSMITEKDERIAQRLIIKK